MALVLELDKKTEEKVRAAAARRGIEPLEFITELVDRNEGPMPGESAPKNRLTGEALLSSPLVGFWKGRSESKDAPRFARRLRELAQNRRGA